MSNPNSWLYIHPSGFQWCWASLLSIVSRFTIKAIQEAFICIHIILNCTLSLSLYVDNYLITKSTYMHIFPDCAWQSYRFGKLPDVLKTTITLNYYSVYLDYSYHTVWWYCVYRNGTGALALYVYTRTFLFSLSICNQVDFRWLHLGKVIKSNPGQKIINLMHRKVQI